MENFNLQGKPEELGMSIKTYNSIFKYTFKWKIEGLSKMYLNHNESPEFQVEPGSIWFVILTKDPRDIGLKLNWYSKDVHATVNYTVRISDSINNALYYNSASRAHNGENCVFSVFDNAVTDGMDKIMKPANDTLLIKIDLEVIEQVTENVPSEFPFRSNSILNTALKTELMPSNEAEEKQDKRANIFIRYIFYVNLLSRITIDNENSLEDGSVSNLEDILTFTNTELLKDIDFEAVIDLYEVAEKYLLTDLKNECKRALFFKVSPNNAQRLFKIVKE